MSAETTIPHDQQADYADPLCQTPNQEADTVSTDSYIELGIRALVKQADHATSALDVANDARLEQRKRAAAAIDQLRLMLAKVGIDNRMLGFLAGCPLADDDLPVF